ncbi:hypothetical protein TNCV_3351201 [Trichonephila clavipes]|nr:hypothetical protein TNCV_3351201 [Trichonephila clavipes]
MLTHRPLLFAVSAANVTARNIIFFVKFSMLFSGAFQVHMRQLAPSTVNFEQSSDSPILLLLLMRMAGRCFGSPWSRTHGRCAMSSSPSAPMKNRQVEELIRVKSVEARSPPVCTVWKFEEGRGQLRFYPRHLTIVHTYEIHHQ